MALMCSWARKTTLRSIIAPREFVNHFVRIRMPWCGAGGYTPPATRLGFIVCAPFTLKPRFEALLRFAGKD
jgi:hypothetical protein